MAKPLVFEILGDASNVKKAFDEFQDHAGKVAAGAAAAFAAAKIGQAIGDSLEMGEVQARLNAQLGGTGEVAAKAGDVAGALFRDNFGESMQDAADAVRAVGEQMVDLAETSAPELEQITAGAMTIADAFGKDVTEVTRAAGQMMKNGLAPDAQTALDIIATGFTNGLDASGDFLDVLTEYADPLKQLGIDGQTALGLFKSGLDSGAFSLDKVGDSLNEFATRAIDGSKSTSEAYQTLGLDAEDVAKRIAEGGPAAQEATTEVLTALGSMGDAVAQDAAGVALFGSMWEDAGKDMVLSLNPGTTALMEVAGATQEMGDALYDTAQSKVEGWRRSIQGGIADLANTDGALGIVAAGVQTFGGDILGLIGVLGPATVAIQNMGLAQKAAAAAAKIAAAAQWLWNAAMSANPIGLIIIAIAALVAGIVWAWNNVDWFREGVLAAWEWIKNAWSSGVKAVSKWLGDLGDRIRSIWNNVTTWTSNMWKSVTGFFSRMGQSIRRDVNRILDVAKKVFGWTPLGLITNNWGKIIGFFQGLPGKISAATRGMWNGLVTSFKAGVNTMIAGWNRLSFTIGGGEILGVKIPSVTLNTPNIPYLATGGTATRAGLAVVGERGPELLHMPAGASVIPLDRSLGGDVTVSLAGVVLEVRDVEGALVGRMKTVSREVTAQVMGEQTARVLARPRR